MEQCLRAKMPLPGKIRDAPELDMGLDLYYDAFWDLHTSRTSGMEVGYIRWIDVHQYCQALELSPEQQEDMHHHILSMDSAYLEWRRKK